MKVLLIVNPIAGKGKGQSVAIVISKKYEHVTIVYTVRGEAIKETLSSISLNSFDRVVVIGGDGTINLVASFMLTISIPIGVIAIGSGNGFARHLKLPMNPIKAFERVLEGNIKTVDVGCINGHNFFSLAGMGYEGALIRKFDAKGIRGLFGYLIAFFMTIFAYKKMHYDLIIDGIKRSGYFFSIALANSNQYGNNFKIAPKAKMDDGLIDVVILHSISIFSIIDLIFIWLLGTVISTKRIEIVRAKIVEAYAKETLVAHFDGEQLPLKKYAKMTILEKALKVYV